MANYQGIRTGQQIDDGVGSSAGAGTGLMVKLGTGLGVRRSLLGTLNRISIENGSGVDGSPTIDIDVLNHLDFMQSSPSSLQEGRLRWNDNAKTIEIGTSGGSNILVGQEEFFRARANENILKGQAIYVSGFSANTPEVNLAKADSQTTSDSVGIAAQNINNNTFGKVVFSGIIKGLNTNSFEVGDRLFISHETKGSITNVRPPPPFCNVSVGIVIKKDSADGAILINTSRTPRLKFLCDVDTAGATVTGQFPVWDNSDSYFKFTSNINDFSSKIRPTGNSLGTSGTVDLNFSQLNDTYQTITLTDSITFTGSNISAGQKLILRLINNSSGTKNITFPNGWNSVGETYSSIENGRFMIAEIITFSQTDVVISMKINN